MIPNLLNTLVGLWLSYMAIFPQAMGPGRERLVLGAAILIVALAAWARRSDTLPWQATTTIVTGSLLAVLMLAAQVIPVSPVLMFWCVLWAGLTAATLSLWGALYRPSAGSSPAE
jgi:hypothetical protein